MKLISITIIFLMILGYSKANCQSIIKGFNTLSCSEKQWVICHLFVAKRAFRITKEVKASTNKILLDSLLDQFPAGGKVDAFRHLYWMARLTIGIGEKKARSLGKAHEKGNYYSFLKSKVEDGVIPDSISGIMDLNNNEVGIRIGNSASDKENQFIQREVINTINRGEAVILKRNKAGQLITCDNEIVVYKIKWSLPYCLVKSNDVP